MTTSTASSSAVFFQQDALSSVTSLTNAAGAVTGRATYDTYGQITTQTGQVSPYTYTGREHEPATGLYQYRARWYDPASGRFVSEDPIPAANLYGYADGRPTVVRDPSGKIGLPEVNASSAGFQSLAGAFISSASYVAHCGNQATTTGAARAALGGAVGGFVGAKLFGAVRKAATSEGSVLWKWVFNAPTRAGQEASKIMALFVGGAISGLLGATISEVISTGGDLPGGPNATGNAAVNGGVAVGELFPAFEDALRDSATPLGAGALIELLVGDPKCG